MGMLFQAWTECEADWTKSKLYLQCKVTDKRKCVGEMVWLTMKQLVDKFGESAAEAMRDYKLNDPTLCKSEVRWHPSAPNVEVGFEGK